MLIRTTFIKLDVLWMTGINNVKHVPCLVACITDRKWVMKLMIEREIMRKIFGRTRTDYGYWRIKTNQEINDTLKGQNVIWFITKQILNWIGHVERMAEDNIVQKINPSAWGHLNPSSYCDVGRLLCGVFKLWSKLCRSLFKIM